MTARAQKSKTRALKIATDALMRSLEMSVAERRTELKLPELPPGVRPQRDAKLALDDGGFTQVMGWANGLANVGCGLFFPGYPYLAELSQRAEYRSPIETIAEEMTRKWIKFTSIGLKNDDKDGAKRVAEKIEKLTQAFTDLGIQDKFRRATEIDGYFGMAKMFVNIDGQDDARDAPLLIDKATIKLGSLKGFKVIEPMWVTPRQWNATDPTAEDFYKPTVWYVLGKATHSSRLINFVSREVPDLLKPSYNFGGMSLVQMLEPYVNDWLRTKKSVADLIRNFSIITLATNMATVLAGEVGSSDDLWRRAQLFTQSRDNRGLMLIDKESEELDQIAVPLGTLDALQAQAQEHMSAITRLPLVKAFGITPKGLNPSSEEELLVLDDHIHARQEIQYAKNLTDISQIVQLSVFGEIDPAIVAEFVPLRELDGEALGRVRKGDAELAATLITSGVISPEEERARLASDPNSGYNNLVVEDVPEPPETDTGEGAEGDTDSDES